METFRQDLTYAFQQIKRGKGIAAMVVLMIAIGIGANTAIFGLFKATLYQAPFRDIDRLVRIRMTPPDQGESSAWIAIPEYIAIQEENNTFEVVGASDDSALTLGVATDGRPAERLLSQRFKASVLRVLGVQPHLGRAFAEGEDRVGGLVPLAMISHRLWETRFAANPDVINSSVLLDDVPMTIIGVMPAGFRWFVDSDVWIPQTFNPAQLDGSTRFLTAVARLRPDVSIEQAQGDMDAIARRLGEKYPDRNTGWAVTLEPLDEALFGETRQRLLILQMAVGLILLITCANVAGLLLVQAASRQREVATRWALGANRFRLVRQFLTESLALALAGGVIGVAFAWIGVRLLTRVSPQWLSRIDGIAIDASFLLFAVALSVSTGVAFGLVPSLQLSSTRQNALHAFGRGATSGRGRQRVQGGLVIGQVALTLVLLIGAGLVIKSFVHLQRADLGIEPDSVLSFQSVQSRAQYLKMTGTRINGFGAFDFSPVPAQVFARVAQRLQEIPGVVSAAGINRPPLGGSALDAPFTVTGRPLAEQDTLSVSYHLITPDFFGTMRIPIVRGRDFTYRDTADGPWVAVINEAMAQRFWPDENPIGQHITLGIVPDERPREIVAVVGNTPLHRSERTATPMLYVPHVQQLLRYRAPYGGDRLQMTFVLRIRERPDAVIPAIREAVAEVDPAVPVAEVQMVEQYLAEQIETPRFYMVALGIFGVLATLLAMFGLYGVIAHTIAQRTREIAIRMALGANTHAVASLVLRQAVALTAIGMLLGVGASLLVTRLLVSVLWDVTPTDATTFVNVALLFTVVATVASIVPTLRALRLEPRAVLAET